MRSGGNFLTLMIAMTCALLGAWWFRPVLPTGQGVTDATGAAVPSANYQRIVSASILSDALLPDLISTTRLVAVTTWHAESHPWAFRVRHLAQVPGLEDLESIIALRPDLVICADVGGQGERVERLRAAGLTVFNLGSLRGPSTMKGNLVDLGALLGEPERAARIWRTFARRLSQVSVHIPMDQRKTALYCSVFDGVIYGGTTGTSYADLLAAAGLVDVAAERFQDWPRYDMEDLLALNPQVIVIPFGRAADLAALPGADRLRAFGVDGQVIELPKSWAQEAGPFLVDVAELLCDRVYGAPVHLLDKVPSE